MKTKTDIEIKTIASAVQYWLSYWDSVSRSNILQEGSLRYSISEMIERKYNGLCVLELPHPSFRKRSIDITWSDCNKDDAIFEEFTKRDWERKTNKQLEEAIDRLYKQSDVIECKIASRRSKNKDEIQRVLNDLCRLYFFKLEYPDRRALFLLSGSGVLFNKIKTGEFFAEKSTKPNKMESSQELAKSYLQGEESSDEKPEENHSINNTELQRIDEDSQQEVATSNIYAEWLSFDLKQRTRTLDLKKSKDNDNSIISEGDNTKPNYNLFLKDYKFKQTKSKKVQYEHITFKTVLIALNEAFTDTETEHSVAIWEVVL